MSQFRKIVENVLKKHKEQLLSEAKVIKVYPFEFEWINTDINIPYLRVYKNPTRSELMSICNKTVHKELRGLCVDNNIYIWDAYYCNHSDILDYLYRINDIINTDSVIYFMIISDTLYISNNLDLPSKQLLQDCLNSKLSSIFSEDEIKQATDYHEAPIEEDTVKQGNSWTNKGKEGTHGTFKTKKQADDQRKAMFANGYKG